MMAQTAMSATSWDGKWEPLTYKLDEWLLMKDELDKKEVNDPSLKLTKQEIAEQVLHDIEGLGRNNIDDWLDEFPLFEEIQTLTPAEDTETVEKCGNQDLRFEQERFSPNDGLVVPDIRKQPSVIQDLFSLSYENSATFILSNENILYINNEPFVNFAPLQSEKAETIEDHKVEVSSNEDDKKSLEILNVEQPEFWNGLYSPNVKEEMAVVDEIIKNTALELDQWESESSQSETSSDSMSTSDFSSKEKGDETDDPDWKPHQLQLGGGGAGGGRKSTKKSFKPYIRGGGNQEEKKQRKKEQNKNAATRYRQKKKAEVCEILKEEESLKEKKAKLEEKVADIQSEIKCLKALMRDLFKAKGIIN